MDHWSESEVVFWRRRGSSPFQGSATPWIARRAAELVASPHADDHLDNEEQDTECNQARPECGDDEPDL